MKSPKLPKPAPIAAPVAAPPPVSSTGTDAEAAAMEAKKRQKSAYNYGKTILRPSGLSTMPPGTQTTLGK